ncbi:MAG: hypothetical protein BRC47_07995 [Cyanobacteria bacterium QS_7_48_42]|jgi:putative NADH-flavin reductase|nr:MAG: hypothetical protein BRC34_07520 [Cyanobacteria bacterium QH_1_48_107]PSO64672.1 MAG: hypothetical protein BRC36_05995 [Cyanobacteria bacterium QH_2_48_84]PSO66941.1 MAG: hypothetical protein BRC38_04225 [Cyanobacteria bacterium QH_6_48_35]PSO75959.1 MAG: hypothetical protein BRC44_17515 [Cyanobacteria bacterium QS_4_48_99]PSO81708.1 MAG: hypothetical protein BRC45_11140 [Cyanobacteria bacterium QS_5_48_63]PSO86686.1 MAG: hypothetical protein BRC43_10515 [Cyanobacteria bacterium QS_3_4
MLRVSGQKTKEIYMQRILSAIRQTFSKRLLVVGLVSLISLGGALLVANQPSYAQQAPPESQQEPKSKEQVQEEEIERARMYSEEAAIREEMRQEEAEKMSQDQMEAEQEKGLIEKAKEQLQDLTD